MKRSEIPFAQDTAKLFLPWITMLMVFIAVLISAGSMTAYNFLSDWNTSIAGSMTVQIPVVDDKGNLRDEAVNTDIENTVTILRGTVGVKGATVLSDEQMAKLMEPWVNETTDITALPLPKIIDVEIDTHNPPVIDTLQNELAEQVPGAVLDSHRIWLKNFVTIAEGCMQIAGFVLLLLCLTTAFTVIYAARTGLSVHKPVISLVHMMGGDDFYIASQYATRTFKLTLLGGIIGFLVALPILFGVSYFFQSLTDEIMAGLTQGQWIILFAMPIAFAGLAGITALQTIMGALKRIL